MAEITSPAEIAGIQEANTAVLPSGMPLNELMLRAGQLRYAMDEAKRQRDQDQINKNAAMFDFDTKGVWTEDVNKINENIQSGIKQFGSVDFLKRYNSGDLSALNEYQQWKNGLNADIDWSKHREAYYISGMTQANKDRKYQNEKTFNAFENFRKNPLDRNVPQIEINNPYNQLDVVTAITPKKEQSTESGNKTTKETPTTDINGLIEAFKNTPEKHEPFLNHYHDLIVQANEDLMTNPNGGTTANPIIEYYDKEKFKNGDFEVKTKPLSDFDPNNPDEILYSKEFIDPAYTKSVSYDEPKSLSNGDGITNKIIPYQEGLATNLNVGNKPTGQGDTKTPNKYESVGSIGGWDFSATAQRPQNINYRAPKYWMNAKTNTVVETAAPYKTIDIVGVYDKKIKPSGNQLGFTIVANPDDEAAKDLKVKRFAMVKDDKNTTFLVPYDEAIHNSLINSGVKADGLTTGDLISPNGTTNTGTQQQGGVKPKEDLRKKYNY